MDNLDKEIYHCISQPKVWKKGSNIENIYKKIIKINDLKEISKDHLLARLATLSNEQKIKIKLFNKSAFYSVNGELIDLHTVKFVPIADTPVGNNINNNVLDIPPIPIVDTPMCDNNNSSI